MSVLRPITTYSTKQFTWNPETKTFSAEASELGWKVGHEPPLGRVYDDACDVGFTFLSEKTGKEITMVMFKEIVDDDYSGGWKMMEFIPAAYQKQTGNRDAGNFKVVIFND